VKEELSPEAWQAKREYERVASNRWRDKNREKYNAYQRAWRARNRDRTRKHQVDFWERKATEKKDQESTL